MQGQLPEPMLGNERLLPGDEIVILKDDLEAADVRAGQKFQVRDVVPTEKGGYLRTKSEPDYRFSLAEEGRGWKRVTQRH